MKWIELIGTPTVGKTTLLNNIDLSIYNIKRSDLIKNYNEKIVDENLLNFQYNYEKWLNDKNSFLVKKRTKYLRKRLKILQYLLNNKNNDIAIFDEFLLQNALATSCIVENKEKFLKFYIRKIPISYIVFVENSNIKEIENRLQKRNAPDFKYKEMRLHIENITIMKEILDEKNIKYLILDNDEKNLTNFKNYLGKL